MFKTVSFGSSKTGLVPHVGYRLYNSDGTPNGARTNVGVIDLGGGQYGCDISFSANFVGFIKWDIDNQAGVSASEELGTALVNLNLAQEIPAEDLTSKTVQTIADCLSAARADGAGALVISGNNLIYYGPNGEVVRTFTLNDPMNASQRT